MTSQRELAPALATDVSVTQELLLKNSFSTKVKVKGDGVEEVIKCIAKLFESADGPLLFTPECVPALTVTGVFFLKQLPGDEQRWAGFHGSAVARLRHWFP